MRDGFAYVIVAIGVAVVLGFVTAFARQVADGLPMWILAPLVIGGMSFAFWFIWKEEKRKRLSNTHDREEQP